MTNSVTTDERTDVPTEIDHLPQLKAIKIEIEEPLKDVELLAGPGHFGPDDELPDEYRELLIKLIYNHAEILDSKPYREGIERQWETAKREAPDHASYVMMARFQYEEMNHGYIFSRILDDLGVHFENYEIKQYIFGFDKEDWLDLALHHYFASKVGMLQISEWIDSSYEPLARVAPRVLREERGHAGMGHRHLKEYVRNNPEGLEQAQERLPTWWPAALDMFGRTDSTRNKRYRAWGLKKHTNAQLREAFIADTLPQLEALGLEAPPNEENRRFL